jgi:RNA polymerase sigma factor (sigma-70 family)
MTATTPETAAAGRDTLVLEHLHLVPAVARRLHLDRTRRPAAPVDRDDYLAAGAEALVRAASTWRPARAAFETHAWTAIAGAMRNQQTAMRWRRQGCAREDRAVVSLDEHRSSWGATIADTFLDPAGSHDDADLSVCVETVVERLRPALREVVRLCWLEDVAQKEVARRLGITQPAVAMRLQVARHVLAGALGGLVDAAEGVAA